MPVILAFVIVIVTCLVTLPPFVPVASIVNLYVPTGVPAFITKVELDKVK